VPTDRDPRADAAFKTASTHHDVVYNNMSPQDQARTDYVQRVANNIVTTESLKGIEKAVTSMEELNRKTQAVEDSAKQVGQAFKAGALVAIERIAAKIGSVVAGLRNIVLYGAQGTIEFELMNQAWFRLSRNVANVFSPAIRLATAAINTLAINTNSFTTEARWRMIALAGGIGITAAAVVFLTGTLALATLVAAGFSVSLIPALGIIVAVIAALVAVPAILLGISAYFIGWEQTVKHILAMILDIMKALKTGDLGQLFFDLTGGGSKGSLAEVNRIAKGGNLTPNTRTTFESPADTYRRIQSSIAPTALDEIKTATQQTAANTDEIRRAAAIAGKVGQGLYWLDQVNPFSIGARMGTAAARGLGF
jgi:ABC-type multidrug transport system fused ATPase/permease subunit